jgi:hypothetical protein
MDAGSSRTVTILLLLNYCDAVIINIMTATTGPSTTNANNSGGGNPEPNPPVWPDTVKIFRETDDAAAIQEALEGPQDPWNGETFTCDNHFSRKRTALLFAPGEYRNKLVLEVGYYVQVAGLGVRADDVKFIGWSPFVPALNKHLHKTKNPEVLDSNVTINKNETEHAQLPVGTSLDSFWRGAENFAVYGADLQWAVSQAAPLRRVHVQDGDLYLHDGAAFASGGHMANARIDRGALHAGGQQQYLFRNVHFGEGANGGAWSMVYAGCSGMIPEGRKGTETNAAVTVVAQPHVRVEKPYVAMQQHRFMLRIPQVLYRGDPNYSVEPFLDGQHEVVRDFAHVRVIRDNDPVDSIQQALDEGKDVVLSPGIYALKTTIRIETPGQVLLGLGLATLEAPRDGSPCIRVASGVPGVRIAGLMLEATENAENRNSSQPNTLLAWGDRGDPGSKENPGCLFDIFVRVGGATTGSRDKINVDMMMQLNSGHIIGDNLWIWRADHAVLGANEESNYPHISSAFYQTEQHEFRAETGLVVHGDDTTIFGLAVEHANGHQTVWTGDRGTVIFYQCEFPYGVTRDFAEKNFRGYLIGEEVEQHDLHAPGIYSNFRNDDVFVTTAISHPEKSGIRVVNPFTIKLDNRGGILSIINEKGQTADAQGKPVYITETRK